MSLDTGVVSTYGTHHHVQRASLEIRRTSPVNSSDVFLLSMPDVPSKTCTTARVPSTSRTCPRLKVPSPSLISTISAYLGFYSSENTLPAKSSEVKARSHLDALDDDQRARDARDGAIFCNDGSHRSHAMMDPTPPDAHRCEARTRSLGSRRPHWP